jgi:hypothetical protein
MPSPHLYTCCLNLFYYSYNLLSKFKLSFFSFVEFRARFNISAPVADSQHRQHGGLMEGPRVQRGQRGRKRHEHCEYRLGILAWRGYVHVCQRHATDDQVMAEGTQDEPLHHLDMA